MDWLTVTPGFETASQDLASIVKVKVEIDFTGTATFVEIPGNLVDSISGNDRLEGSTGYAIANTCSIQFNNSDKRFSKNVFAAYNPSIGQYNGLQQSDTRGNLRPGRKVKVSVTVGDGNEWLQRYIGFVGESGFVETIGAANSNTVTINLVDLGKYLKDASLKTPGGATPVYTDKKISDPADQANSLVHIIGNLAGLSPSDIVADTIPIVVPYAPFEGSAWEELAYLAQAVFATLTVTTLGKVYFGDSRYATGYTSPTSQFTFTNNHVVGIQNPDDFGNIRNDITLKFSIPEWLERQTIWQFKEKYDTKTGKCDFVIPAGDTSLDITNPDVEYAPEYGIYQAGKEFEVLLARNISNQAEFESLLETSGGDLDVEAYDITKYPTKAVLRLANNEVVPVTLQVAKIKGEPLVRNTKTEVKREDTPSITEHGRKEQVIESKYFTEYVVASGKPHYSDYIQYLLEWKKTPRQLFSWSVQIPLLQAQVGSRVTLAEVLAGTGINEIGIITQITWSLKDGKAALSFSMRWELDNPTPPQDIIPSVISSTGSEETSISSNTILTDQTFFEDFSDSDVESRWTSYGGALGEISVIQSSNAVTGGKYLSVGDNSGNDERYLIANQSLAYDPQKLYRIRVRARRTFGTGLFFCGVAGRNYDQSEFVNVVGADNTGNQHYFAALTTILSTEWVDYEGYFRGTNTTGNGGLKPEIDGPGTVHENAKYISPLLLINYNDQAGTTQVDFVSIDIVPEITNPQLTISLNESHVGAANGKAIIYGFNNYRNADKSIAGFVYINGLKYQIPINSDAEVVSSQVAKGYMIYRYRNGFIFTLSTINRYVAFVKYEDGVWYYDNGSSWQELTQAVIDDSVIIGTMETINSPPFQIKTAQIYANPTDIELAQQQDWVAITGTPKPDDYADVTGDQTVGNILPNWNLDIKDSEIKPAGIRGVESIADRSQMEFGDSNRNTLKILGAPDTSAAYGFPAIPVDDRATYTVTIRHRSENPPSTNGYYLRMNEKDSALAPGKTHIGTTSGESVTDQRTSIKSFLSNAPTPGQNYVISTYEYIPTVGTKYASFSIYNFPGITGWVEIDYVQIAIQASSERDATLGATWGTDLASIPDRFTDSPTDGLNVTETYMGYYKGSPTNAWRSFIGDTGSVYFGDGGLTFGTDTFFQWDVPAGKFYLSGDASFSGTVLAAANKFKIDTSGLYSGNRDQTVTPVQNDIRIVIKNETISFEEYETGSGWARGNWIDFIKEPALSRITIQGDAGVAGRLRPETDNFNDLGLITPSVYRWRNLFMSGYQNKLQVNVNGEAIREKQFAEVSIGGSSSTIIGTFLGSTNTVYCSATHREANATVRNAPKTSQTNVGADRVVTGWNTDATTRIIHFLMEQGE